MLGKFVPFGLSRNRDSVKILVCNAALVSLAAPGPRLRKISTEGSAAVTFAICAGRSGHSATNNTIYLQFIYLLLQFYMPAYRLRANSLAGHTQIVTKLEHKCHRTIYQNFVEII
jgi:hypothetical protein